MSSPEWLRIPYPKLIQAQDAGLHKVYRNTWWVLDADENALFYGTTAHPQCNIDLEVARYLAKNCVSTVPGFVRLPMAYVPVSLRDLL